MLTTLCNSLDGSAEHYAKWNKPGSERQTQYDLTYKWNLINKTNKRTKYNQRHWNKEQTDSNQRGGGRRITGKKEEGPSRNMYKGHRDKTKGGRFKGRRWGWVRQEAVVGWKWRPLHLNNNYYNESVTRCYLITLQKDCSNFTSTSHG